MIAVIAGDAGEFEGAFDHSEWGIAVAIHDAIAQRPVIGADAHGDAARLAEADERAETFADAIEFRGVLVVRILDDFEFFGIGVVTWIDAHFFDPLSGFHGGFGFKVDIGDERDGAAVVAQAGGDGFEIGSVFDGGSGDADDFASDGDEV